MKLNISLRLIGLSGTNNRNDSSNGSFLTVIFRKCDLYDESDNYIFIKYGETDDALNKTFTELKELFVIHGVERDKLDYILESVKSKPFRETFYY